MLYEETKNINAAGTEAEGGVLEKEQKKNLTVDETVGHTTHETHGNVLHEKQDEATFYEEKKEIIVTEDESEGGRRAHETERKISPEEQDEVKTSQQTTDDAYSRVKERWPALR